VRTGPPRFLAPLLLAPALAVIGVAFLWPLVILARMSLNRTLPGGAMQEAVTAENYAIFVDDSYYYEITGNSVALSLGVTVLALLVAYPIALFLYRWQSPWRGVVVVLTISPLLVSAVVRTYAWIILLGDRGWVNTALQMLGVLDAPLRLVNNMTGVVIGLTQIIVPYMALALIAGFGRLDRALEEAALSLGASPFRAFLRVTLPLSLPGVALGSLLCFVLCFSSFITPKLLGGGRAFLLATEIYDQSLVNLNWPMAATISIAMLAMFGVALVAYNRLVRLIPEA
jgi:putative spermidine/putrescine transport system permease protein